MNRSIYSKYNLMIWDPSGSLSNNMITQHIVAAGFTSESADYAEVVISRLHDGQYEVIDPETHPGGDGSDDMFMIDAETYDILRASIEESTHGVDTPNFWVILFKDSFEIRNYAV